MPVGGSLGWGSMREVARWDVMSSLVTSRSKASADIATRIEKGKAIRDSDVRTMSDLRIAEDERSIWDDYNRHLLSKMFDSPNNSAEYDRVMKVAEKPRYTNPSWQDHVHELRESIDVGIQALTQLVERLELYREPLNVTDSYLTAQELKLPAKPITRAGPGVSEATVDKNRVFVVHGHDDGMKETVARFVERLGLEAIILHEQPSAGKTVIEKLEAYSNVGYVVVLLSPDDIGASRRSPKELHPRPRQNVVFEMGFFVGKLTRDRVCAIVLDKVEIHSDIQGVVYIPMDDKGAWQVSLAKELKKAGFRVTLDALA